MIISNIIRYNIPFSTILSYINITDLCKLRSTCKLFCLYSYSSKQLISILKNSDKSDKYYDLIDEFLHNLPSYKIPFLGTDLIIDMNFVIRLFITFQSIITETNFRLDMLNKNKISIITIFFDKFEAPEYLYPLNYLSKLCHNIADISIKRIDYSRTDVRTRTRYFRESTKEATVCRYSIIPLEIIKRIISYCIFYNNRIEIVDYNNKMDVIEFYPTLKLFTICG